MKNQNKQLCTCGAIVIDKQIYYFTSLTIITGLLVSIGSANYRVTTVLAQQSCIRAPKF